MAHKLPSTESFSDSAISNGSGPRWTLPTLYWPCKPWDTTAGGHSDPTGLGHLFPWAKLNDAYKAQTGLVTPTQWPADGDINVGRAAGAYVFKGDQRTDCEVRMTHIFQTVSGDPTGFLVGGGPSPPGGNTYAALGARIQGAAGTDFVDNGTDGYTESLRSPTGYWFVWGTRPAGSTAGLYFQLLRVNGPASAGAASDIDLLVSSTTFASGAESIVFPGDPQAMRFTVTTNGAVAELRGFWTQPSSGVELEVVSFDDGVSGLAILGEGHCGFWAGTEVMRPSDSANGPYQIIHGVSSFDIRDLTGNIIVRDEWQRTNVDEMDTAGADQFGRTGNVVTGQFTGDQAGGDSGPDFVDRLVRASATEQLEVDNTPIGGFHIWTDPASSIYPQAIGGNFTLASGSSNRIWGLLARIDVGADANWQNISNGAKKKGYSFVVEEIGSAFLARVRRYTGNVDGDWDVIAYRTLNKSGDGATVAVTVANDYLFEVENIDGSSAATGNVKLTCSIDGWTIDEWIMISGISEATDGAVVDSRTDRVLGGNGIGFFAKATAASQDIFVNSLTRPTVTLPLDEREQASIFIGGEKEGTTGTLTVPHEWPVKTKYRDYGVKLRYESMHIHRHAQATNQRRLWTVRSDAAKPAEVAALRALHDDPKGVERPFSWTTPDSESVTVTFVEDSLQIEKTGPNSYSFLFEIDESLGPEYPTSSMEDFNRGYIDSAVGGKVRTLDPALGDDPLHPVWHFEDDFGSFTVTVNLSAAAPLGGMYVRYDLGGTAVDGTHYTVVSGSASPLFIAEGASSTTFDIAMVSSGKWYEEKLLTIKLADTTDGPIDPVENELHVYIRPDAATLPPACEWESLTYSSLTAGADHTIQVKKLAAADTHEDNMELYFEVDKSGAGPHALEGVDWDFIPSKQSAYGVYTLSPSLAVNGLRDVLIRSYGSASTKSLKLNLWHDFDDASNMNRYTMTHNMDAEADNDGHTVKPFPREPSDNAFGPAGIIPPKPWDYLQDPTLADPFGGPVHVFRLREVAGGSGYHRKSFNGQIFCAGHEEGVIKMPTYTRFSFYVRKPTNYELPRFIRIGIRDRGGALDAPQNPTGSTHSQATSGSGSYTTLTDTNVDFTVIGVLADGKWEVNNLTKGYKAEVSNVTATVLTLTNQTVGTGAWDVNDYYYVGQKNGVWSGSSDGKYEQNYAIHFETNTTPISGATLYDGSYWRVHPTYGESSNWNAGSSYGIEEETIRDNNGIDQDYLRLWITHHEDNADAIDNGQVRIWYPVYFGSGVNGSGEDLPGNIGKALGVFWPMLETKSSAFPTSAPGRYQPRTGYWWTPNGGCVIPVAGKRSTTLSWT